MKTDAYMQAVASTLASSGCQRGVLTLDETYFIHGVLGVASESGELLDIAKKFMFHGGNADLNWAEILDETGDILWYIAVIIMALGTTFERVMAVNIAKLKKRYPDGFTSVYGEEGAGQ